MIVIRLIGGLGNQMFIYALGKSLALKNKQSLYLDETWIKEMERKNKIILGLNNYFFLDKGKKNIFINILIKIFNNRFIKYSLKFIKFKSIIQEKKFSYNKELLNINLNFMYILDGYWQSYKYFEDYEDEIKKIFSFDERLYHENKKMVDLILNYSNSVSIHVRRGDYEKNPQTKKVHGNICTFDYYKRAIEIIKKKIEKPIFFVFSDDIDWCKKKFKLLEENFIYSDINEGKIEKEIGHRDNGYIDMYLMTLCKNNIIANSSFSWWAAYLNPNKEKVIIAPQKWFNDETKDTKDLCPESWIKVN